MIQLLEYCKCNIIVNDKNSMNNIPINEYMDKIGIGVDIGGTEMTLFDLISGKMVQLGKWFQLRMVS